ncbi:hypothetical protein SAMN05421878_11059 [Actinobaculum suis]|uniref:Pilus assembly protein n=1 Tax=Actinobaculum suis TaxID=1657 RepID=A0A1G7DC95_9ACTO|nr:TadE family protein [Actinobaculum suis]MDY5153347.1 pilus assembly protein [Actinobaculum suis]SDE48590.1 hypothetical protein SAMN05421878_11059 [Actinobaculum suis]
MRAKPRPQARINNLAKPFRERNGKGSLGKGLSDKGPLDTGHSGEVPCAKRPFDKEFFAKGSFGPAASGGEQGSAVVGFAMLAGAIIFLFLALAYIGAHVWIQRQANDAALRAARTIAVDNSPHSIELARQQLARDLPQCACELEAKLQQQGGLAQVEAQISGEIYMFGPAGQPLRATAHALVEWQ